MSVLVRRTVRESRLCLSDRKKYFWPSSRQFSAVFCLNCVEVVTVFALTNAVCPFVITMSSKLIGNSCLTVDRLTEHKRATRNGDANNHVAVHHQLTNHNIDWDSAQCLTYSTKYFQRLTLESWYTNLEQTPLNRCQQLPAPYKRLIRDESIGNHTVSS